jgi:hypothetical protein
MKKSEDNAQKGDSAENGSHSEPVAAEATLITSGKIPAAGEALSIAKPDLIDLEKFRPKREPTEGRVGTLPLEIPVRRISEIKDFVRLHPSEDNYWTTELCFIGVPVAGDQHDSLHVIEEDIADRHLLRGRLKVNRLALAADAGGAIFWCTVPSQNLDNSWVKTNLKGCMCARERWVRVTSRKQEDPPSDSYRTVFAANNEAFPKPRWPTQPLAELFSITFAGKVIDREDHPGLLRLIGEKVT